MSKVVKLVSPLDSADVWVTEAHGFYFLSSVDGVFLPGNSGLDSEAFGDGPRQAANAYGEIVRRLNLLGIEGSSVVRVEHATASQDWRLQRMALWPKFFGPPTTAVSQGYQGKMVRQNMISVATIAAQPSIARKIITPGPNAGRASRVSVVEPFVFVIGVRGETLLSGGDHASDGTAEDVAAHVERSLLNIDHHLTSAGLSRDSILRLDAFVRTYRDYDVVKSVFERFFPVEADRPSLAIVACPLGGQTDIEVSAVATQHQIKRYRSDSNSTAPSVSTTDEFAFIGNVAAPFCMPLADTKGSLAEQVSIGLDRLRAELQLNNLDLASILRLDVYASSQYDFDLIRSCLESKHPNLRSVIVWHGIDLPSDCSVDFSAIAAR